MKKIIIIPTFNEKSNITTLIEKIINLQIGNLNILVIDDNSPDGTSDSVAFLQKNNHSLILIKRPRRLGLASAYIEGFRYALNNGYDLIIQMDGDLSHDPVYLPIIIDALRINDFVIGSRYVKGGKIINWPVSRRFISLLGCWYARIILNGNIKDYTGGYNGWNNIALKTMNWDKINSNGYSFQIEIKFRALKNNFKFLEIPIVFQERQSGKSKISKKIILEAIYKVWWLKFFT